MNRTKCLTGVCSECGGSIEFQAELVGTLAECPRCHQQTELLLAPPPEEPAIPRKVIFWTVVAVVILVAGLIVLLVGLKKSEKWRAHQRDRTAAAAGAKEGVGSAGLEVSAISLERGPDNAGSYVVGTVSNSSGRRRSRVTVEFDLLDDGGRTLQVARAYRPVLEAGAKWEIKLPVAGDSKAVSAKLASIKEEQ